MTTRRIHERPYPIVGTIEVVCEGATGSPPGGWQTPDFPQSAAYSSPLSSFWRSIPEAARTPSNENCYHERSLS